MAELNSMQRYSRQTILSQIGESGQKKLKEAAVLVVGAGGLGSVASLYLAAAGVGRISIADADEVRLSNLNRQILYNEGDLGKLKAVCARENLQKFNSDVKVMSLGRIDESNIIEVLSEENYSSVIDATDNFETRYVVNSACVDYGIPFIYGSVLGWNGQVSVLSSKNGPCYRCVYPESPSPEDSPTCHRAGVVGVVPGVIGAIQAGEAIKLIACNNSHLIGRMLLVDILISEFKLVDLTNDPRCPVCS